MTREEARKMWPIIKAFSEGKEIEFKGHSGDFFNFDSAPDNYNIKNPASEYRFFNSREECWQEMQKHQPFGWLKEVETGDFYEIGGIWKDKRFSDDVLIEVNAYATDNLEALFDKVTFADGIPFGVKEEKVEI